MREFQNVVAPSNALRKRRGAALCFILLLLYSISVIPDRSGWMCWGRSCWPVWEWARQRCFGSSPSPDAGSSVAVRWMRLPSAWCRCCRSRRQRRDNRRSNVPTATDISIGRSCRKPLDIGRLHLPIGATFQHRITIEIRDNRERDCHHLQQTNTFDLLDTKADGRYNVRPSSARLEVLDNRRFAGIVQSDNQQIGLFLFQLQPRQETIPKSHY